jgi:HK97 family phage major capsid protein
MPGALDTLRTRRSELFGEMQTLSTVASPTDEQRARFRELDTEVTALDADITIHEQHAERERRAAEARAAASGGTTPDHTATGGAQGGTGWSVEAEPTVYGRGSGHSYFMDLARRSLRRGDGDGGVHESELRLDRHAAELRVEMPRRAEARTRRAHEEYENAHRSGNRAERRAGEQALTRLHRAGVTPFESRAMNRVDGTGGYLVPPLWLIDERIDYLRAGRDFANLWRNMPLPAGTDSINIPRIQQGSATGPQAADGAAVNGRDTNDAFVNAKVQTISGQMDVALQLLDQSPIGNLDEILYEDLTADLNLNLSGQCFVGSGTGGQINGVWPGGTIANTNGIYLPNTNNTAAQTWVNGGGATFSVTNSIWQGGTQTLSLVSRTRLRPPTHHVWHPWVWYNLLSQVDQQGRPLVVPGTPNNVGYNQIAVDDDGPVVSGPVGYYQGLPVILDPNMPTTFGGTSNPQITTISAGQFAPTPGVGTNAVYTPLLSGMWNDLFLWEGELRTRALDQVLSGNLQMRFQIYSYVASMPNRYQAYADVTTGASGATTVAKQGSSLSYATLTQHTANGVLNMMGGGF